MQYVIYVLAAFVFMFGSVGLSKLPTMGLTPGSNAALLVILLIVGCWLFSFLLLALGAIIGKIGKLAELGEKELENKENKNV